MKGTHSIAGRDFHIFFLSFYDAIFFLCCIVVTLICLKRKEALGTRILASFPTLPFYPPEENHCFKLNVKTTYLLPSLTSYRSDTAKVKKMSVFPKSCLISTLSLPRVSDGEPWAQAGPSRIPHQPPLASTLPKVCADTPSTSFPLPLRYHFAKSP